jgi:hypothetical protein
MEFQDILLAEILVEYHEQLAAKYLVFYWTIINTWRDW